MSRFEILQHIETTLASATGKPVSVTEESNLIADEIIDSLEAVRFIFELEKAVGVRLPDGDLDDRGLFKVSSLITYIEEHKGHA